MHPKDDKPTGTADIAERRADRNRDDYGQHENTHDTDSPDVSHGGSRSRAAVETGGHAAAQGEERMPSRSFPNAGKGDAATAERDSGSPLLGGNSAAGFRERWEECQRSFVDEPRESVKGADQLVAEVMQELAGQFAETRSKLERQWDRGGDVSTEDLRIALQRYRDFFNRLLAA